METLDYVTRHNNLGYNRNYILCLVNTPEHTHSSHDIYLYLMMFKALHTF